MRRHADRVPTLLRHGGIVDDEKGTGTTHQPAGLAQQRRLKRRAVPDTRGDEVVELVIAGLAAASGHRLHALAITGTDQTSNILRTHPAPRRMRQPRQERLKPSLQIASPALVHRHRT